MRRNKRAFDLIILLLLVGVIAVIAIGVERQRDRKVEKPEPTPSASSSVVPTPKLAAPKAPPAPPPKIPLIVEDPPPAVWIHKPVHCGHINYDKQPESYAKIADYSQGESVWMTYGKKSKRSKKSIRKLEHLLSRADAYQDRYQTERAIQDLKAAIALEPEDFRAYQHLAWAYGRLDDFEAALEAADKTLELEPDCLEMYADRSWYHHKLGHTEKSDADWAVYTAVEPDSAWAYSSLASELYKRGLIEEAETAADLSFELDEEEGALGTKGHILLDRGQPEEALVYFTLGVEETPWKVFYRKHRAEALEALGRYTEAAQERAEIGRLKSEVIP